MTTKKANQIRVLKSYIEKAIKKTTEIESSPFDKRIEKVNTELTRLIGLIDQIKY